MYEMVFLFFAKTEIIQKFVDFNFLASTNFNRHQNHLYNKEYVIVWGYVLNALNWTGFSFNFHQLFNTSSNLNDYILMKRFYKERNF